jgi:hypothetical protein
MRLFLTIDAAFRHREDAAALPPAAEDGKAQSRCILALIERDFPQRGTLIAWRCGPLRPLKRASGSCHLCNNKNHYHLKLRNPKCVLP